MDQSAEIWRTYRNFFLAGAVLVASLDASANSRMGSAEVKIIDGQLCFSLPENEETRDGIPLFSIFVSEEKTAKAGTLPAELWHLSVMPRGKFITLSSKDCIAYGREWPGTVQRSSITLAPLHVYSVFLHARPEQSNLIGYDARFCIIPLDNGKFSVKSSTRDDPRGHETLKGCSDR